MTATRPLILLEVEIGGGEKTTINLEDVSSYSSITSYAHGSQTRIRMRNGNEHVATMSYPEFVEKIQLIVARVGGAVARG